MNEKYNIPITIFVFKRLETVQKMFDCLKEIKEANKYYEMSIL